MTFDMSFLLSTCFPFWLIYRCLILFKRKKDKIKINLFSEILVNLFVLYLFFILGIRIFPIHIGYRLPWPEQLSFAEQCNLNILPFVDFFNYNIYKISSIKILLGNFLLLIPLIIYLCAMEVCIRNLKSCTIISFLVSISIELTQLITNILNISNYRIVDVNDLILNTLGGALGLYIFEEIYKGKLKEYIDSLSEDFVESDIDTVS